MLADKHIILGVTGGIAAYKAAELARLLKKQHARVTVVMTDGAREFISPLTFSSLTGEPVHDSLWHNRNSSNHSNIAHINLTREADALLIAPCTANVAAKIAAGMADDLLTNLALARDVAYCPLAIAPAMNVHMWHNPATVRNMRVLADDGVHIFGPAAGEQACGEVGDGRMLESLDIVSALDALWVPQILAGKRVLISAGPTFEAIDPVRGITNHSSGKMGYALAHAACAAGAQVTLVSGKTALTTPYGVTRVDVVSAQDMLVACEREAHHSDVFIAVAAVADWQVAQVAAHKLKKTSSDDVPNLTFVQTPDILARIANSAHPPFCVGFAAESEHVIEYAQAKRLKKNVPLMIANHGPDAFGRADNQVAIVSAQGVESLPLMNKNALAHQLVARIAVYLVG